jgi:hypothetical protein
LTCLMFLAMLAMFTKSEMSEVRQGIAQINDTNWFQSCSGLPSCK